MNDIWTYEEVTTMREQGCPFISANVLEILTQLTLRKTILK